MLRTVGAAIPLGVAFLLAGASARIDAPSFIYTATPRYEPQAWNRGEERFPEGAHLVLLTREGRRELAPALFASADAAVSYDGHEVLFAGRSSKQDHWQIWRLDLARGTPQRVLTEPDDCVRPLYLPDGKIAYTRVTPAGSMIEVVASGGGKPEVLTYATGRYLTSDVLHDGRILFEARGDIFTVYPDGTGMETLRCDHGPQRSGARQVSSGDVIFDVDGGLARFTSASAIQQKLALASGWQTIGPVAEAGADRWLVAARSGSRTLLAIYQMRPSGGGLQLVDGAGRLHAVDPVVVAARVPPREFPSARVPTRKSSHLLCLNAAESKERITGRIESVRVYTQGAGEKALLLGQTAVAGDGSFYVEVPADRPIRMELLDASGKRLAGEEHWFWMRPSEQRICVGCHAGPERAPDNRVPDILNQILHPVRMLGGSQ